MPRTKNANPELHRAVGRSIRTARETAGMSQEGLAERLDVSAQSISKWESGDHPVTLANLFELARILDVGVDTLLGLPTGEHWDWQNPAEVVVAEGWRRLDPESQKIVAALICKLSQQ